MQPTITKKWQATYIAPLNHLPLLCSHPGGFYRSWSCRTCRCKYTMYFIFLQGLCVYKIKFVYCNIKIL